jgi:hypothetical protein
MRRRGRAAEPSGAVPSRHKVDGGTDFASSYQADGLGDKGRRNAAKRGQTRNFAHPGRVLGGFQSSRTRTIIVLVFRAQSLGMRRGGVGFVFFFNAWIFAIRAAVTRSRARLA